MKIKWLSCQGYTLQDSLHAANQQKNTNEKTTYLLNLQKNEIFQCYNSTLSLLEFGAGIQLALNVRNKMIFFFFFFSKMKIVENFTSPFCQEIPLIGKVSLAKITVFLFSFSFFFFTFLLFSLPNARNSFFSKRCKVPFKAEPYNGQLYLQTTHLCAVIE